MEVEGTVGVGTTRRIDLVLTLRMVAGVPSCGGTKGWHGVWVINRLLPSGDKSFRGNFRGRPDERRDDFTVGDCRVSGSSVISQIKNAESDVISDSDFTCV